MRNAILLKDISIAVRDVSSGGCLIETSAPLPIGTIGWLEVEFEGMRRFEWFRVARVQPRNDRGFVAGVEFLPLGAAETDSMRSTIGRLRQSARPQKSREVTRKSTRRPDRESGDAVAPSRPKAAESGATILNFSRKRS